jgi:hypothetical protein
MMPNPATTERPVIELPREAGESARAYAARVEYVTMGPGRSIDKVADQRGIKTGSRSSTYLEWSRKYGWVACAQKYDDAMTLITVQEAAEQYRKDLEDHRKRYGDAGKSLWQVGARLLQELNAIITQPPKVIEGKDGRFYKIPGIELTPQTLAIAARAMTIAADLEAHALRLGDILPRLDHDVLDSQ